jgi:hypothetical protein
MTPLAEVNVHTFANGTHTLYFFLPDPNDGCQPAAAPFWLGAAAIILTFAFFGFFDSRLLFAMRAP